MFGTKLGLPEPIASLIRPGNNRKASKSAIANTKKQQHQSHQQQVARKNPIATPPKPPIKHQQQTANNNFTAELNNNNNSQTFNGQHVASSNNNNNASSNLAIMTADRRNISTSTVASSGYNSQTTGGQSYFLNAANGQTSTATSTTANMGQLYAGQRPLDSYLADDPVAMMALSHQRRRRQAIRVAAPIVPMMIDDDEDAGNNHHHLNDLDDNNLDETEAMIHRTTFQHRQVHDDDDDDDDRQRRSFGAGSRRLIDDDADDGLTTSMMLDHHFIEDDDDDDDVDEATSDNVSQFRHHHHYHHHQCADSDELAASGGQFYLDDRPDFHVQRPPPARNGFSTYNARQVAAFQYLQQNHRQHLHQIRPPQQQQQQQLPNRSSASHRLVQYHHHHQQQEYQNGGDAGARLGADASNQSLVYQQPYLDSPFQASLPPINSHLQHQQHQHLQPPRSHDFLQQSSNQSSHSKSLLTLSRRKMQQLSSPPTDNPHHNNNNNHLHNHNHNQQYTKRASGHVTNSTGSSNNNNNNNIKQFKSANSTILKSSMPKSLITANSGGGGGAAGGKNRSRTGKGKASGLATPPAANNQAALSCCGKLAKLLLFITNALFWLAGVALATWGILALVEDHKYNLSQLLVFEANGSGRMSLFQLLSWSFITLGCATVLVGFCGCSALFKNNRWILGLYIFLILAIFALDLATGLLGIIFQERLVANVRLRLVNKLRLEYGVQASFTAAIDYIQTKFECCGLDGHFDYDQSVWRLQRLGGFEATVARTCCHLRNTFDDQAHVNPRPVNESMCQSMDVRFHQSYRYRRGCLDDLEKLIRYKIWTFTIGCAAVGVVILISMLFATCFCRSIPSSRKNSRTPADDDQDEAEAEQQRQQQVAVLQFPDQTTTTTTGKKHHHHHHHHQHQGYSR